MTAARIHHCDWANKRAAMARRLRVELDARQAGAVPAGWRGGKLIAALLRSMESNL